MLTQVPGAIIVNRIGTCVGKAHFTFKKDEQKRKKRANKGDEEPFDCKGYYMGMNNFLVALHS